MIITRKKSGGSVRVEWNMADGVRNWVSDVFRFFFFIRI